MFYKLLFLLVVVPALSFTRAAAPEAPLPPPSLIPEVFYPSAFNKHPSILYFESVPIISYNEHDDSLLYLIPVIVKNTLSGEKSFQIVFEYFPNEIPAITERITPFNICLTSNRRELKLPVLHGAVDTDHTKISTVGCVVLFSEEIEKLYQMLGDVSQPYNPEPITYVNRPNNYSNDVYLPSTYTYTDLLEQYEQYSDSHPALLRYGVTNYSAFPVDHTTILISVNNSTGVHRMRLKPFYAALLENVVATFLDMK